MALNGWAINAGYMGNGVINGLDKGPNSYAIGQGIIEQTAQRVGYGAVGLIATISQKVVYTATSGQGTLWISQVPEEAHVLPSINPDIAVQDYLDYYNSTEISDKTRCTMTLYSPLIPNVVNGQIISYEFQVEITDIDTMEVLGTSITSLNRYSGEIGGFLGYIAQSVQAQIPVTNIVSFSINNVDGLSPSVTRLQKQKWYTTLYIDGDRVPDSKIQNISITIREGEDRMANIDLYPDKGLQSTSENSGLSVKIYGFLGDGVPELIYNGQITNVTLDLISNKTKVACASMRQNTINSDQSLINALPDIGYYTTDVFGAQNTEIYNGAYDELNNRMSTIPYSFDYDTSLNWRLTPLLAKDVPDITLYDQDVYRENNRDPDVQTAPWSRLTNYVKITSKYQYQRAYQREVAFNWPGLSNIAPCTWLAGGYTIPLKSLVQQAIQSAGWPVNNAGIKYIEMAKAGFYNCGGTVIGFATGNSSQTVTQKLDSLGNPVTDTAGNPVMVANINGGTDYKNLLCQGASWTAAKRWMQQVEEQYTIYVSASQSIAQFGQIEAFDNVNVVSNYSGQSWETFPKYEPFPLINQEPAFPYPTKTRGIDKYADMDTRLAEFNTTQVLAIGRAKTKIIRAHRDHKVTYTSFFYPGIDIFHTVKLDCTKLKAQGKVVEVVHTLNCMTTEANTKVTLALSRSEGSASETPLAPPQRANYVAGAVTPPWAANVDYVVGQTVQPVPPNGYYYKCVIVGKSAGFQPAWPVPPDDAEGSVVLDNTITWSLEGQTTQAVAAVNLGTHYGEEPPVPGSSTISPTPVNGYITPPAWNGFVGNKYINEAIGNGRRNYHLTTYPVQMIVDAPGINESSRANGLVLQNNYYNVVIQNDLLLMDYEIR